MELLLARSIPNLNSNHFVIYKDVLRQEVNAHGRLHTSLQSRLPFGFRRTCLG